MFFELDKSKHGKTKCPACGRVNAFRKYRSAGEAELYTADGQLCGICDRANTCGHHVKPDGTTNPDAPKVEAMPDVIYLEISAKKQAELKVVLNDTTSNFHLYVKSLGIPFAHLKNWGIGTEGEKTAFIFIDQNKLPINVKYFKYQQNGGRDKDFKAYSMKGKTEGKQEYRYKMCLFGEHLLGENKIVVLVESEKTAVIGSYFYPAYHWLSCASGDGLTDMKAKVLKGYKVVWLADADEKGRKNSSLATLKRNKIKHKIVDLFPERADGYDIADAIRDGLRPELGKAIDEAPFVSLAQKKDSTSIFQNLKTERILPVTEVAEAEKIELKIPKNSKQVAEQAHSISYDDDGISYFGGSRTGMKRVASGFQIFIRYQNKDENDKVYWLLEIVDIQVNEEKRFKPITMEFNNEQFNSARYWKSEISKHALSFKVDDTILTELIEFLFLFRKFNRATRVLRYGWHAPSQTFLFANCGFDGKSLINPDENGMLETNGVHISLPQLKTSNNVNFFWTDTKFSFTDWYKLFSMAYPKEAFVVANHYMMSLFLDVAQSFGKKNPILYIKGKPNSGKTTMIEVLSHNYGYKQNKTSLKSNPTPRAVAKLLNQTQNGFLHCDEFKNGMPYTDTFISAFDFEGFERSTDDAASGNETESFPVTRGIVITSNDEPTYEPFISRLIYIVKDDINKTEAETKAFIELDTWLKKGLACISVELLAYRQLIVENYKACFDELLRYIKGLVTDLQNVETRNFSKTTQTLIVGYILAKYKKIDLGFVSNTEKDILLEYANLGANQLRLQHRMSEAKTALHQFFEFFQSLYDQKRIYEGSHFRIDHGKFIVNLNSFYPIYQKEFFMINKEMPQSKSEIFEALKSFDENYEVKSSMRFANIEHGEFNKTLAVKNCISVDYNKLKIVYGLDLDNNNDGYQPSFT